MEEVRLTVWRSWHPGVSRHSNLVLFSIASLLCIIRHYLQPPILHHHLMPCHIPPKPPFLTIILFPFHHNAAVPDSLLRRSAVDSGASTFYSILPPLHAQHRLGSAVLPYVSALISYTPHMAYPLFRRLLCSDSHRKPLCNNSGYVDDSTRDCRLPVRVVRAPDGELSIRPPLRCFLS